MNVLCAMFTINVFYHWMLHMRAVRKGSRVGDPYVLYNYTYTALAYVPTASHWNTYSILSLCKQRSHWLCFTYVYIRRIDLRSVRLYAVVIIRLSCTALCVFITSSSPKHDGNGKTARVCIVIYHNRKGHWEKEEQFSCVFIYNTEQNVGVTGK